VSTVEIFAQICYALRASYFVSQLYFKAKNQCDQHLFGADRIDFLGGLFCNSPFQLRPQTIKNYDMLQL
jgi:hypothetical protein